jgi:hypothetical protein
MVGQDSVIGAATRFELYGSGIESRQGGGARFSVPVQTGAGAHSASYAIGRVRLKRGGTQLREEGRLKGKQANDVGSQLMKRKRQVRACPALLPAIKS